ncbi:MAG TPA: hypothetical protein VFS95_12585, partial [Telluria sp.]|nr:hypothetical protein [Telluria sp.]
IGYSVVFRRYAAAAPGHFLDRAICIGLPCAVRTLAWGAAGAAAAAVTFVVLTDSLPIALAEQLASILLPVSPFAGIAFFNFLFFRQMCSAAPYLTVNSPA